MRIESRPLVGESENSFVMLFHDIREHRCCSGNAECVILHDTSEDGEGMKTLRNDLWFVLGVYCRGEELNGDDPRAGQAMNGSLR